MNLSTRARRRAGIVVAGALVFTVALPAAGFAVVTFTDVPRSSVYYADVQAAVGVGAMSKCTTGKFCPKAFATREQLARVANRIGALSAGSKPVVRALSAVTATTATKALTAAKATLADNATNAGKLDGIDSTGFVPRSGQVIVNAGSSNWKPFTSADNVSATYFSSQTQWTKPVVGSNFLSIQPDIPVVMNGTSLEFTGVQLCYEALAGTALQYIEVNTTTSTVSAGGRNLRLSDPTSRTDAACRLYILPTPVTLTASDNVNLFIQINWSVAGSQFAIGRTSFVFNATGTAAAAPATQPAGTTTVLRVGGTSRTAP